MNIVQARLPETMIKEIDELVKKGEYSSRSDFIKDAIRNTIRQNSIKRFVGIIPDDGIDSVKQVREIRKKMTIEDLKRIREEFKHMTTD